METISLSHWGLFPKPDTTIYYGWSIGSDGRPMFCNHGMIRARELEAWDLNQRHQSVAANQ